MQEKLVIRDWRGQVQPHLSHIQNLVPMFWRMRTNVRKVGTDAETSDVAGVDWVGERGTDVGSPWTKGVDRDVERFCEDEMEARVDAEEGYQVCGEEEVGDGEEDLAGQRCEHGELPRGDRGE